MQKSIFEMALGVSPESMEAQIAEFQGFVDVYKKRFKDSEKAIEEIILNENASMWKRKLALYSTFQQIFPGVVRYKLWGNRTNEFSLGWGWSKVWSKLSGELAVVRDRLIEEVLVSEEFKLTDDLRHQGFSDDEMGERSYTLYFCDEVMRFEIERAGTLEQQKKCLDELRKLRSEKLWTRWCFPKAATSYNELDFYAVMQMLTDENAEEIHLLLGRWRFLENLSDRTELNNVLLELCVRVLIRMRQVSASQYDKDVFTLPKHMWLVCEELSARRLFRTRKDLLRFYSEIADVKSVRSLVQIEHQGDLRVLNSIFINEVIVFLRSVSKDELANALQESLDTAGFPQRLYRQLEKESEKERVEFVNQFAL